MRIVVKVLIKFLMFVAMIVAKFAMAVNVCWRVCRDFWLLLLNSLSRLWLLSDSLSRSFDAMFAMAINVCWTVCRNFWLLLLNSLSRLWLLSDSLWRLLARFSIFVQTTFQTFLHCNFCQTSYFCRGFCKHFDNYIKVCRDIGKFVAAFVGEINFCSNFWGPILVFVSCVCLAQKPGTLYNNWSREGSNSARWYTMNIHLTPWWVHRARGDYEHEFISIHERK